MKHFELWLDESGDFKDEQLKKRSRKKPSLIGGILLDKQVAGKIDFANLLDAEKFHATELELEDKTKYVLAVLETMKVQYGAVQVFFENADYEDDQTNRQLYLRIMAEGLLQLMVRLNAIHESVELDVIIARRQDMTNPMNKTIQDSEYIYYLKNCIDKKVAEHRILLNDKSRLRFTVKIANITQKLNIADFACNTRLTRDSQAFANERTRLNELYEDAIVLSMNEVTSENYFRCCLAMNAISDALVELFTTKDIINRGACIQELVEKIKSLSYRIVKSQLRQFAVEITAIAAKEDDFEIIEKMLKLIDEELITRLHIPDIPYQYLEFNVLLCLADAYLREGDIIAARNTLARLRSVQQELGNHLEDVFTYYQLIEKETLYYIDSFQFQKAVDLMSIAENAFKNYMKLTVNDSGMQSRFPELTSEYYGDALCMDIYALMFLQRHKPELYEKMVELSDIALQQYPNHEGELERHRQYRSHIELEHGDCRTALMYLRQAKEYDWIEPDEQNIEQFLNALCDSEIAVSCQYYLMYYLLIADKALQLDMNLATMMWKVLTKQKRLLAIAGITSNPNTGFENVVQLGKAQSATTHINYHPLEIIYWKYANLQAHFQAKLAKDNYIRAIKLCERYSHYITMRITGLGVRGDYLAWLAENAQNNLAGQQKEEFVKTAEELLAMDVEQDTAEFVKEMLDCFQSDDGNAEQYKQIAQKITY